MLKKYFIVFVVGHILINIMSGHAQSLAFPEAEGFGRFAAGGRGGDVYHVTNLNDDGTGSLRHGIENMEGPRTIVFDISGTILLKDRIRIEKPNLTIAGQTAPGEGITLANEAFYVYADDAIVRYIRCRLGDQSGGDDDAVSINKGSNIIFDHVTASWSIDETFSCQSDEVDSLTVQWCMITESLHNSHHEKGAHGYGGIIGSLRQSFHHNLYAHHSSRSPKVTWRQHTEVDFRNNVIYNWGYNNCYDGTTSYMNWANNYYKSGPATNSDVEKRIFRLSDENVGEFESYETSLYAEGNFVVGYPTVSEDNWNGGIDFDNGATEAKNRKHTPHDFPAINESSAVEAYPIVVAKAVASLQRDEVDERIANEVIKGISTYGNNGIIDSQTDVGGWPAIEEISRGAGFDTDQDGMPNEWEIQNNLDPSNPEDRNEYTIDIDYTNLEVYLNSLIFHSDIVLSAKAENEPQYFNFYPNPADSNFSIELNSTKPAHLKIYSQRGQVVYQDIINHGIQNVDSKDFIPGLYIIQIRTAKNEIVTEKIIIK